ncbi:hypothetical protein Q5752_004496 [Cryptotrichosporon argae]
MTLGRRVSTAVFDDLPDHEYWNTQKGPYPSLSIPAPPVSPPRSDSSTSDDSALAKAPKPSISFTPAPRPSEDGTYDSLPPRDRAGSAYSRRLSRKLPPRVTESLENLAITPALSADPGAPFSPLARLASISADLPPAGAAPTAVLAPGLSHNARRPSTYSLIPALPLIQSSPPTSFLATMSTPPVPSSGSRPSTAPPAPAPVPVPPPVQTPAQPLPARTSSLASRASTTMRRPSLSTSDISAPIITPSSSWGAEAEGEREGVRPGSRLGDAPPRPSSRASDAPSTLRPGSRAGDAPVLTLATLAPAEHTIRHISSVPSLSHSARMSGSSYAPSLAEFGAAPAPALRSPHFARLAGGQSAPADAAASTSLSTSVATLTCSPNSASVCGTWAVLDDIEQAERAARTARPKETRKQRKERKRIEADGFNQQRHPTIGQLFEASELDVIGEDGARVKFGDLVSRRKTIVVFIRHWFCPLCAQYIKSIIREISPEALEAADVDMIIIGNGSDKMIDGYRNKHFKCPFRMYTDPSLRLYRALGLTRQTGDAGADEDAGDYLTQSAAQQTVETVRRAMRMPLRRPGHFLQLGGEFVFDGPLSVAFTNRMTTTRDHRPIRDVVAAAGVRLEFIHFEPGPAPPPVHRDGDVASAEPDGWEAERAAQLERIQARKAMRRQGAAPSTLARATSDTRAAAAASATIAPSVTATLKVGVAKSAGPFTPVPVKPSVMRRKSSVRTGSIRIVQASENVEEVHGEIGTVF